MGFLSSIGHAISGAVKHVTNAITHPQDAIKTVVGGVKKVVGGVGQIAQGNFKQGLGGIFGGAKNILDPDHLVGATHNLIRPITNPINDALAGGIKGLTGHNILGSHPLNAIGTAAASVFTAGAAGAAVAGASIAGSLAAGVSALEATGGSILGAAASGLEHVGLSAASSTVGAWAASANAAAASTMAASGTIAGQMGLIGSQANAMNLGAGITKAGSALGDNFIGRAVAEYGANMTGNVSEQLAASSGKALGSFGFTDGKMVQGTLGQVASATDNFGGQGVFSSPENDYAKDAAKRLVKNQLQGQQQQPVQQQQGYYGQRQQGGAYQGGQSDPYGLSAFSFNPLNFKSTQSQPVDGVFAPANVSTNVPNTTPQPQQFTAF